MENVYYMNPQAVVCPINNLPAKHYVTKGRAEYYIEPIDGIIFQSELPTVTEMETFNQHEYKQGSYRAYFEMEHLKKKTAARRLHNIQEYGAVGGQLLDVGCSVGFFLEVAQDFGFDVQGVELSSEAIAIAKDTVKDKISHADANEHIRKYGARYDVVTAYDIIEHTQNPNAFLKDLYNALKQKGVVAITAPDTDHFLRYVMGSSWSMLQPMQHTFLLSKRSIKTMLTEAGFEDVMVLPAKKTLTLNYLFGQLSQTNPIISRLYNNYLAKLVPSWFGDAPMDINIGEFFAIARKPSTHGNG
jgi:2-polyprenyl-3-methyl-5-hydroxy-6-metoxy-1,4-benzoquinol methylase